MISCSTLWIRDISGGRNMTLICLLYGHTHSLPLGRDKSSVPILSISCDFCQRLYIHTAKLSIRHFGLLLKMITCGRFGRWGEAGLTSGRTSFPGRDFRSTFLPFSFLSIKILWWRHAFQFVHENMNLCYNIMMEHCRSSHFLLHDIQRTVTLNDEHCVAPIRPPKLWLSWWRTCLSQMD